MFKRPSAGILERIAGKLPHMLGSARDHAPRIGRRTTDMPPHTARKSVPRICFAAPLPGHIACRCRYTRGNNVDNRCRFDDRS
jgi:hypothetical protein